MPYKHHLLSTSIQVLPLTRDDLLAVRVSGTRTSYELDYFKDLIRHVIEQFGEVRLCFEMDQFDGWQIDSFLENAFFDLIHVCLITSFVMKAYIWPILAMYAFLQTGT